MTTVEKGMAEQSAFQQAVFAAKHGDRERARRLLRKVLIEDPGYAPAWLWMSGLVETHEQQRDCLERVLALDPSCDRAREGLEILKLQDVLRVMPAMPASRSQRPGENRKLGSYLVDHGFITAAQLEAALQEQISNLDYTGLRMPLGDILIRHGWLTPQALATALLTQQKDKLAAINGKSPHHLGEYLVVEGIITPEQLAAVLAQQAHLRVSGRPVLLGELLLQSGYVTRDVLQQVLERQREDFFSRFGD